MALKIRAMIEIDGPEDWSDLSSDWGQQQRSIHDFTVLFGDGTSQAEAVANTLQRLIQALGPPRLACFLADLSRFALEDRADALAHDIPAEIAFFKAACELVNFWDSLDSEKVARKE